jgi:zinc protease
VRVLVAERHVRSGRRDRAPVIPAGARTEGEREAGVSHFLEHMMFQGHAHLRRRARSTRLTTQLGGQNNAFTGYDHTAY